MSCPRCAQGYILPDEPKGSIQPDFSGAYLAPNPDAETTTSDRAVIVLTDVFGLPLKNPKLIADTLAERLRCDVWVPDYFNGRPIFRLDDMEPPEREDDPMTIWDWLRVLWKTFLPNLGALWSNRSSVVDQRLASFIPLLKEKKGYKKIGAVGYCFGGSACIRLASTGLIDGGVICHPGPFSLTQVRAICTPVAWVCAERDEFFANSKQHESEAELAGRKGTDRFVDFEFKEYKGTVHGFACRPNLEKPEVVESYKSALDQTASWFEKTLVS
ncbi:hypothetical protein H1R20_g15999, partial [Candolleomyces eurysporus]